jgi:hypothetical protein
MAWWSGLTSTLMQIIILKNYQDVALDCIVPFCC